MKRKGVAGGILSTVIVALIVPLIITLMFVVQVNFSNSIDQGDWSSAHNGTMDTIDGNANDSYDMAGILPIALIGIAILVAIIAAIGGLVSIRT